MLALIALVVLSVARCASLILGSTESEPQSRKGSKKGVVPMVRHMSSSILETMWAIGVSTVAGLPLLT